MGLLRLLLALAVVAAHAGPPAGVSWLRMTDGPASVQIFYVISGFYMTLILNEKYVGDGAYAAFAKSRLLRLVPMFLVVLVVTVVTAVVLQALLGRSIEPWTRWRSYGPTMPWGDWIVLALTNVTIVGQDLVSFFAVDPHSHELFFTPDFHHEAQPAWQFLLVPQAWTVSIELMFYALAPLLVRRRPWVIAAMALLSFGLRAYLMKHYGVYHDPWTYRFFPTELLLFLGGALAFHGYRWATRLGLLRPVVCWLATLGMLGAVLTFPFLPQPLQHWRFGLPGLLLVVIVVLPFVFEATRTNRLDRALGELSYPVYLVHYLLVFVVATLDLPWLSASRSIVIPVATLVLAWLLWRTVGLPLESRRQRLVPRGAGARALPGRTVG